MPYLTEEAGTRSALGFIASLPHGAHVVFDYSDPPASLPVEWRIRHERRAQRVSELGEAWLNYMEADPLHAKLRARGFTEVEESVNSSIAARYFPHRARNFPDRGGHILRATTI